MLLEALQAGIFDQRVELRRQCRSELGRVESDAIDTGHVREPWGSNSPQIPRGSRGYAAYPSPRPAPTLTPRVLSHSASATVYPPGGIDGSRQGRGSCGVFGKISILRSGERTRTRAGLICFVCSAGEPPPVGAGHTLLDGSAMYASAALKIVSLGSPSA